ncbi:Hypothetical protein RMHFA_05569 (plasmid) [Roseomonas mucosa]|nr:Hypothetical protein RMHFA_05569 [Roseomonas mucosa]
MVQSGEPALGVHAGPHGGRGAQHEVHLAVVQGVEQRLLGFRLLVVLHEGNALGRHAEGDQALADPAIGREAPRGERPLGAQVREDHLRGARHRVRRAVRPAVAPVPGLLPDAEGVPDQQVELVLRLVVLLGHHEAQVDRGVPAVGNDGEQDVLALLGLTLSRLDRLDALGQVALVGLEGRAGGGGDDLALAARDRGQPQVLPQVVLQHHVRDGAEHGDQVGHVDELGEARHRLVEAGGLQFQLGAGIAEIGRPGVELLDATLLQHLRLHEALQGEHLAQGVGDGRARGQHQRPARIDGRHEARLHEQVPGPLRAVRGDALEAAHVGGEGQLAELLRLVGDQLVHAHLGDGQHVVLGAGQAFQLLLHALLHALDALAGDAVLTVEPAQQGRVGVELCLHQAALELRRRGDELERRMGDDDAVPVGGRRPGQEAAAPVLAEVGLVGHQDAGTRVELQELA